MKVKLKIPLQIEDLKEDINDNGTTEIFFNIGDIINIEEIDEKESERLGKNVYAFDDNGKSPFGWYLNENDFTPVDNFVGKKNRYEIAKEASNGT
jgi:hypothetical protein